MNDEDALVAVAVQRVLGEVVKAVDETVARLEKGGRFSTRVPERQGVWVCLMRLSVRRRLVFRLSWSRV